MKKKDDEKRLEVEHQKMVSNMIKSANGRNRSFAQIHRANGVERMIADSGGGRRRCQAFGQM